MGESRFQLVVFDLGGVLVRIAGSWAEALERAGAAELVASLDADGGVRDLVIGLGGQFELGQISEAEMIDRMHRALEQCSRSQASDVLDAWVIEPYPRIESLFERSAAAGLVTACLSNTNERHWRTMMHLDGRYVPLRRLEYRIASHLIGVAKPGSGAYEAIEQQTGVDSAAIIFFDDTHANCQAAAGRGWEVRQIDPQADPVKQMSNHMADLGVW